MSNANKRPILITGSHRSGSTWVGRMIALSSSVGYIHEPFNLRHRLGICKAKFDYWFTYICDANESFYFKAIEDCLHFKYQFGEELRTAKSTKDIVRLLRDYIHFTKCRILKKRPLVKDPIAVFSAEWLAKRFDMDVVVLIRHPAAFAGSLKKAKWTHRFNHFLQQPLLIQHHLYEYRSEIEEYSKTDKNIVDQAILLWNLIHHMILKYRDNNPDWIFVKHEELSKQPVEGFRKLYERLGLNFTVDIQRHIKGYSFSDLSKENLNSLKRNSKSNVWSWKTRLTDDEIKKIKKNTREIASRFYTEEDWVE